ncbi:genetic suppressor element 1-like isoform X1 [Perca flavescens]|uniref:genetic suppressor element 1-like isoform X1 n=2 Tax=Perca flavescens TaxID=8167 RepID=UPI00106F001A|nr:genetic suppressor element 1-like isoform X1 [Perca flavescens]
MLTHRTEVMTGIHQLPRLLFPLLQSNLFRGMNHESKKSPPLGMISTATRTTATVSPISPLTNGNAVAQSANSGFAAALRKLAKQAEDPRGSALSGESSPVSSPATSHSSPVTTPKRGSLGPLLGQTRGHGVPSTPPVVTIAPTKTSNGLWRADGRQVESSVQGLSRERVGAENTQPQQDKRTPPHPLAHPFGLTPNSVMQDPRIQSLSLPGQMHPVVPSGAVPEEYLRALRPFATSEDLRLTSLPLSLDPAAAAHAAAAAAYYHPAYLHHPLSLPRMEESLCLSALRSQFYSVPAGGAFSPLHPSALHLHLPGGRYPGELNHTAALAERLQMENELRQREREQEREREKEREREAGLEREREREREREEERERELDRQKERQRERHQQMVRAAESHYLAELQARRAPLEDRARPGERLTPNRLDKSKDFEHPGFPAPKPLSLQPGLHSSRGSIPHPVPSLVPSHLGKHHAAAGGIHGALAAAMMTQRASEAAWLTRQRGQGQEREGPLEMGLRSPGKGAELRRDSHRTNSVHHKPGSKDLPPCLGAPPPLISPKGPHHPPAPPTTLWNPASLVDTPTDSRRKLNPPTPPSRPPPGLTRADRPPLSWGENLEEGGRGRGEGTERYTSLRGASLQEAGSWNKAEQDRAIQSLYHRHHVSNLHQRSCVPPSISGTCTDLVGRCQAASPSPARERQGQPPDSMLVYDEVLQQHRRLLSKLDLEEKRRREARQGGYYYDLDESYDESDKEEVKAHLRRVTKQPPLKLDTSSEKVDFLRVCGLTTVAHRDELLARKRRKRRRMMRERSVSPPAVRGKRKASSPPTPTTPLTTPYSAEQMDSTAELDEKKDFLLMFNLSHVSPQQRRDKERTEKLLRAIQRKTVTLDTLRYNPLPPCSSPPAPSTGDSSSAPLPSQPNGHLYPDSPSPSPPYLHKPKHLPHNNTFKASVDTNIACVPPPLAPHHEKAEFMEAQPNGKLLGLQNGVVASPQKKDPNPVQNGRNRSWERFTPEAFAQHFHQAVLQSTHNTLQNKGVSNCVPEAGMKADRSLLHNVTQLKSPTLNHAPQHAHVNGHHFHSLVASRDTLGPRENLSDEDEEESGQEEEEEEEMEENPRKWQGIEAIFEAYQEYVDEWSIERQVLHGQCKRLEAQNYNLTRTAEQLSLTMGELVGQRQKVREERERLQAQLEHFRRCLTLPNIHWGRGQVNGHTPR